MASIFIISKIGVKVITIQRSRDGLLLVVSESSRDGNVVRDLRPVLFHTPRLSCRRAGSLGSWDMEDLAPFVQGATLHLTLKLAPSRPPAELTGRLF